MIALVWLGVLTLGFVLWIGVEFVYGLGTVEHIVDERGKRIAADILHESWVTYGGMLGSRSDGYSAMRARELLNSLLSDRDRGSPLKVCECCKDPFLRYTMRDTSSRFSADPYAGVYYPSYCRPCHTFHLKSKVKECKHGV